MGFTVKRDDGQEVEIDVASIIKIAWEDVSGEEHEVEGHLYRKLEQEPAAEGRPVRVTHRDEDGQEHEVEGHYARYSDVGLKRDVRALRGVSWRWRDEAPAEARRQPGIGVIAQDVEAVFPELVTTGPDGIKRVDYAGLVGPLIEAVKELDARVRELEHEARADPPV